jgi:hypothetical protein
MFPCNLDDWPSKSSWPIESTAVYTDWGRGGAKDSRVRAKVSSLSFREMPILIIYAMDFKNLASLPAANLKVGTWQGWWWLNRG